jgi:hypothetical protein
MPPLLIRISPVGVAWPQSPTIRPSIRPWSSDISSHDGRSRVGVLTVKSHRPRYARAERDPLTVGWARAFTGCGHIQASRASSEIATARAVPCFLVPSIVSPLRLTRQTAIVDQFPRLGRVSSAARMLPKPKWTGAGPLARNSSASAGSGRRSRSSRASRAQRSRRRATPEGGIIRASVAPRRFLND